MSKEREASLDKLSLNQYAPARAWGARFLPLALLLDLAAVPAAAQNFHWDGGTVDGGNPAANANGGTGTWDTTITNWDTAATGGASTAWVNGNNNAVFGGTGGTVTLGVPVTAQNLTFTANGYTLTGSTLALSGVTPTVTGTGTISSVIAGTAGMTTGGGNATLTLSGANTFTGPLTITHGVTAVSTGSVILASGGSLATSAVTIGTAASSGPVTVAVLQNQGNNQLTNATVTFNAVPTRWAYWQLLGTGQAVLGVINSSAAGVIEGTEAQVGIGNSTLTLTGSGNYSFNGFMRDNAGGSGTIALVKTGSGTQTLSGGNITHSGATTVNGGTLALSNATAYRSATTVNGGATLELAGTINNGNNATSFSLTLNNGSTLNKTNTGYDAFNTSNVAINGTVAINVTNNGSNNQLFIGGTATGLTGSGTINLTNTGSATTGLSFRGNGTFSGTMNVSGGVINIGTINDSTGAVLTSPLALQNTDLNLTNSARLNLAGAFAANATNASVKTLSGNSTATVTLGGQTLTLGTNNGTGATFAGVISGTGALVKTGTGTQTLTGSNTYTGTTTISAGTLQVGNGGTTGTLGTGAVSDNASLVFNRSNTLTVANAISGTGSLTQAGSGTTILAGAKTYSGGTFLNAGTLQVSSDANLGNAAGGLTFNGGTLRTTATFGTVRATTLNAGSGTFETQAGTTLTQGGAISGAGALTKTGAGTLLLTDAGTYTGGTTISAGTLQLGTGGTSGSIVGDVLNNGTLTFNRSDTSTFDGAISGTGSVVQAGSGTLILSADHDYAGGTTINAGTLQIGNGGATGSVVGNITNNAALAFNRSDDVTYGGVISGTGSLTQAGSGQLTLTGTNTFTGGTTVNAGLLTVTGSLASGVDVLGGGSLGGTGTIGGNVTVGGTISPGNSIGTINIVGNYIQNPGSTYQVELNAAGQSDLISITGNATINGGTVAVQAGSVARNGIYTIVKATGSVAGAYSGLSSNFAFLTPSLSYDAHNVYLTFQTAFAGAAQSGNQKAVGAALDQVSPSATGDLDTAVNALANLTTQQGLPALEALSGQAYADFGTMNVNNGALFMNALAQQMTTARGGGGGTGQRQALAQACDIVACDGPGPWSAWASALGGLGSVLGDGNTGTLTYNFGGAAAGVDYRFDPRFLVGIGVGYTHGTQWVNGFVGQGWTDSVSVAAYGSFTPMGSGAGFYVDALAGYAYYNNQLQRQISIPGLQPRTATGSTGANQFLGQVEAGYKLAIYAPAAATITPFGRLQASSVTQNAFTEAGAQSLSLNVAPQTTNSLRTVLGADLAGAIGLGNERKLDLALRLGWMHEFAYTGRPITATFSGGPSAAFTISAATPQRDSAIVGFLASTSVTDATQIYLRYDGAVGGGTDNHMLNVGVRFSW